ncbi:unnamed protein product [Mesocestoides corti]|uniref:Peptidase M3A/M3B catalytic domain-containing protein n=1 Tax=Mesocestoides corti TaxID=53468 RepID=A0A0R3U8E4_MESCO|nr:unnamed protein product [Mesocestoides corti]
MLRRLHRRYCGSVLKCVLRSNFTSDPMTDPKGKMYYVIPEIPTDTPLTNPFHDTIKVEQIFTGVSKQIIEFQVALSQLVEGIKSKSFPITYENIVTKLDEIVFPVYHSLQLVEGLGFTNSDPAWRLVIGRLLSKFLRAQCEHLYSCAEIYRALHTVLVQLDPNDKEKRGLIEQLLAEGWSNGASLSAAASGKVDPCQSCANPHFPVSVKGSECQKSLNQLSYLRSELLKVESLFEQMVTNSAYVSSPEAISQSQFTGRYESASQIMPKLPSYLTNVLNPEASGQIPVAESDLSASAPLWLPYALGGKQEGGYFKGMRVNLSLDTSAQLFLRHCSNRELRRIVWEALVRRASLRSFGGSTGQHASNDHRIEDLRRLRSQVASAMGAPDWLSLVWKRTAPGGRGPETPDSLVDQVLEPIRTKLVPLGRLEWDTLNEWAEPHLRISPSLEHYDIAYAIEQYNFTTSLAPGSTLSKDPRYERVFPFQATVDRILASVGDLFGLSVSRLPTGEGHAAALNIADSFVYEVVDTVEGVKLGEVLVDLNPKEHFGAASFNNVTPVPLEALDVAAAFGNCIQHVASRAPSYLFTGLSTPMPGMSFAGSTSGHPVRDNFHLTQDLIKLLLIRSREMRRAVFGNDIAGITDCRAASNPVHGISRIRALPFLRTLYESRFDLELWASGRSSRRTWRALSEFLWSQHLPYSHHPEDQWPCSALSIFGPRGIPGMRYSEVWRQVIALDCVSAFTEAGFDKDWNGKKVKELFRRYRKSVLDPGTSLSCRSVFRSFRGRDPSPNALLDTFDTSHITLQASTVKPVVDSTVEPTGATR